MTTDHILIVCTILAVLGIGLTIVFWRGGIPGASAAYRRGYQWALDQLCRGVTPACLARDLAQTDALLPDSVPCDFNDGAKQALAEWRAGLSAGY